MTTIQSKKQSIILFGLICLASLNVGQLCGMEAAEEAARELQRTIAAGQEKRAAKRQQRDAARGASTGTPAADTTTLPAELVVYQAALVAFTGALSEVQTLHDEIADERRRREQALITIGTLMPQLTTVQKAIESLADKLDQEADEATAAADQAERLRTKIDKDIQAGQRLLEANKTSGGSL